MKNEAIEKLIEDAASTGECAKCSLEMIKGLGYIKPAPIANLQGELKKILTNNYITELAAIGISRELSSLIQRIQAQQSGEMKLIRDEKICSYCPSNNLCFSANGIERVNCNLKKLCKGAVEAQLAACQNQLKGKGE
jgi:hypothetical protein